MTLKSYTVALVLLFINSTQAESFAVFDPPPEERFKATQSMQFKNIYSDAIHYLIMRYQLNQVENHFCILGYKWPNDMSLLLVWKDTKSIYYGWSPQSVDPTIAYQSLIGTNSMEWESLHTKAEIEGSIANPNSKESYIEFAEDCNKNGEIITIPAFPAPKNCPPNEPPDEPYDAQKEQLCKAISIEENSIFKDQK